MISMKERPTVYVILKSLAYESGEVDKIFYEEKIAEDYVERQNKKDRDYYYEVVGPFVAE